MWISDTWHVAEWQPNSFEPGISLPTNKKHRICLVTINCMKRFTRLRPSASTCWWTILNFILRSRCLIFSRLALLSFRYRPAANGLRSHVPAWQELCTLPLGAGEAVDGIIMVDILRKSLVSSSVQAWVGIPHKPIWNFTGAILDKQQNQFYII